MTIKNAAIEDSREIATVLYNAWQTAFDNILKDDYPKSIDVNRYSNIFENNISNKTELIYVVKNLNDSIVGFVSGRDVDNNIFEIVGLYVDPNFQKNGIGKTLLTHIQENILDKKYEAIRVRTLRNATNNAFYEKF